MNIDGKIVLITGASSGIGEAAAKAIAQKHGRVLLVARNAERLENVSADIAAQGGTALTFTVDLSDAEAVHQLAQTVIAQQGIPDIIINNAGAGRWQTVEETSSADAEQMMAVPYFAAFNLTREFLPHMRRRGSGQIVNVTSVASRVVWPGAAAYTAARWAINGFSKSLSAELSGSGVKVTLAIFGSVNSPFWVHNPGSKERLPKINRLIPSLTSEDVARAIIHGIEWSSREIVRPRIFRIIFLLNALFPRITDMFMRLGWRRSPNDR